METYCFVCDVLNSYLFNLRLFSDYKKAKQDIKKCAADTVRLQKKVKKGNIKYRIKV